LPDQSQPDDYDDGSGLDPSDPHAMSGDSPERTECAKTVGQFVGQRHT
jgi:hypothetical protein